MTNRLGEENHLYDFTETSGNLLDKVGNVNTDSASAGIDRTGSSWIFDGVAELATFNINNSPLGDTSTDDYTIYVIVSLPNANGNREPFWSNKSGNKPYMQWNDDTVVNTLNSAPNLQGVDNWNVQIAEPAPTVKIGMAMSVVSSTDVVRGAVLTSLGESGTASLTHGAAQPENAALELGKITTKFGNVEYHRKLAFNVAHSLVDIQDTLQAMIFPAANARRAKILRGLL